MTRQLEPIRMNKRITREAGDFRPKPIEKVADPEPEAPKGSYAPASAESSPVVPEDSSPEQRMGDHSPVRTLPTSPTPPSSPASPSLPSQLSDAPESAAGAVKGPPTPQAKSGTQPS